MANFFGTDQVKDLWISQEIRHFSTLFVPTVPFFRRILAHLEPGLLEFFKEVNFDKDLRLVKASAFVL